MSASPEDLLQLTPSEAAVSARLLRAFGLDPAAARLLHRGEGLVFAAARDRQPLILKVIASTGADSADLQARLNWILFLHQHGLFVPELVTSCQDRLIETAQVQGQVFLGYAYVQLPLTPANQIDWTDPALPVKLGEMMARMHLLARSYHPDPGQPVLGHVFQAPFLRAPESNFHPSQAAIFPAIRRWYQMLAQFPRQANNYGLIHDDLHTGNVYHIDGRLAVIDFDNCHYHWLAADIAAALLFRVWIGPEKEHLVTEARAFLRGLLTGYQAENELPPAWEQMLPYFLKLRELSLYASFYHAADAANRKSEPFFSYLFNSLSQDRPFLPIDYTAL